MALKDLLAQKAELERQIAEAQREERAEAIQRIRALMAEYGLTAADIAARPVAKPARAGPVATGKVAPKYRDPVTGDTWSGRGLQPKWLKSALAAGKSLSDFAL